MKRYALRSHDSGIVQVVICALICVEHQRLQLPYGISSFVAWRTVPGTVFADKTHYIEQLENFQSHYRFMFLRPRRFGKSAFLNMLCEYYDIHKAGIFKDLFGPLYIGNKPTPWRNKHLVLKFDLSAISVGGSVENVLASFNKDINGVLVEFVKEYNQELRYPEINNVIDTNNASQSLKNVMVSYRSFVRFVNICPVLLTCYFAPRFWLADMALVFL